MSQILDFEKTVVSFAGAKFDAIKSLKRHNFSCVHAWQFQKKTPYIYYGNIRLTEYEMKLSN